MEHQVVSEVNFGGRARTAKDYLLSHGWRQNESGRWVPPDDTGVSMYQAGLALSVSRESDLGMEVV